LCSLGPTAGAQKIEFQALIQPVIQQRLERVALKLSDRRAALESMFGEAGCKDDSRTTQPVPRSKEPNVICTLPGETENVIVVGAHFDHGEHGLGAVDTGAEPRCFRACMKACRSARAITVFCLSDLRVKNSGCSVRANTSRR
jgi:hypothetical protein